jgi:YjjG family noncanonical pyrimidine nucleotidase
MLEWLQQKPSGGQPMRFQHLLFDADDTLFDFPKSAAQAFSVMCQNNDIPETAETYQLYDSINAVLWAEFEQGKISKDFVTHERYVRFLHQLKLDRDPSKCNQDYLAALGEATFPLPHAEEVCHALVDRGHNLYIVTNAVASVQKRRLQQCTFSHLFTDVFISEDAGAAKPSKAYFDYVCARIPGLTAENALVIGDSLTTDIRGANNAGFPCCWFNPKRKTAPPDLTIHYEIQNLPELLDLV